MPQDNTQDNSKLVLNFTHEVVDCGDGMMFVVLFLEGDIVGIFIVEPGDED